MEKQFWDLAALGAGRSETVVGDRHWPLASLLLEDLLTLWDEARLTHGNVEALAEEGAKIADAATRDAWLRARCGEWTREEDEPAVLLERYLQTWPGLGRAVELSVQRGGGTAADAAALLTLLRGMPLAQATNALAVVWTGMLGRRGNDPGRRVCGASCSAGTVERLCGDCCGGRQGEPQEFCP